MWVPPPRLHPMSIRVLLVDDEPLVRSGARAILDSDPEIDVVAEAGNGREAMTAVHAHHPTVVLMDLLMPEMGGIEATRAITSLPHPPQVVVLTTWNVDESLTESLRAGAIGFLVKTDTPADVLNAVRSAAVGEAPLSPSAARYFVDFVREDSSREVRAEAAGRINSLTEQERAVTLRICSGLTTDEVAQELYIAAGTVKKHLAAIFEKLQLTSRVELAWWVAHALPDWRPSQV